MINWILGLFGGSQWALITIGLLTASTVGAGYLLKESYKDNGEQSALTEQYKAANLHSINTLEFEREQFKVLQQKLIRREEEYQSINSELTIARKEINEIPDESGCLDVDLGPAFWLSLESDNPTSEAMRTD